MADTARPLLKTAKDFGFLPIPAYLRYYEGRPQQFGLMLQITFGFASTFSECALSLFLCPVFIHSESGGQSVLLSAPFE